jgi:hypothetical protein
MVAYTYLVAMLAISTVLGYLTYRAQSERRRLRSIFVAVSSAIGIAFISGIVFFFTALTYPADDDPRFAGRNIITVSREYLEAGHDQLQKSNIKLAFPFDVHKNNDFEISLVLAASPEPIAVGSYVSALIAPKTLELRPERAGCAALDVTAACTSIAQPKSEITLSWDVTPTAEAVAQVRVMIPAFWPSGNDWTASVEFDGRSPVYGTGPGCNNRWAGSMDSPCQEVFPVKLGPRHPSFVLTEDTPGTLGSLGWALPYAFARPEIDLGQNQVRFPIRVVTSLGLDADTYAKLALLGTVLSGFLGSGWAWKILELLKAKKEDKLPAASPQDGLQTGSRRTIRPKRLPVRRTSRRKGRGVGRI